MKKFVPLTLQANRIRDGQFGSDESYAMAGAFRVIGPPPERALLLIVSSGTGPNCDGWEHVSVSVEKRCPTWDEMCFVKSLFWSEDECVMQLHPPKSEYVNFHKFTLHMWRPLHMTIPVPPRIFVGPKT